ncbi:MAG TPA: GNAT family N-acetyltransferase [Lacunisphaera sp.]|nr:GNAT family N-acetyltransferase [Lacunisphaera sp.]
MDRVFFQAPNATNPADLEAFEELVVVGAEVNPAGLAARIKKAELLGFAYRDDKIVGVGAIKNPTTSHRKTLTKESGFDLAAEKYPLEIGWLFVKEEARGAQLGRQLLDGLVAAAGKRGMYGTSRVDVAHGKVHASLEKRGFVRVGRPFPSLDRKTEILLFAREPTA